jgi:hypothetical protein
MDSPSAPCPDVSGAYSLTIIEGAGCGDLNASARQCIRQSKGTCDIQLSSPVSGGSIAAINGNASIDKAGSFDSAALTEGTLNRTGCTGSWNAATSTMTVDCGGTGSSQACVVALHRTNTLCN